MFELLPYTEKIVPGSESFALFLRKENRKILILGKVKFAAKSFF